MCNLINKRIRNKNQSDTFHHFTHHSLKEECNVEDFCNLTCWRWISILWWKNINKLKNKINDIVHHNTITVIGKYQQEGSTLYYLI